MTKRETKRRRARARAAARGAERAAAAGVTPAPKPCATKAETEKTGLRFLLGKGRLTKAQCLSGIEYGACYRIVQMQAVADPIKSCLDIQPRGGGTGLPTSPAETLAWIAEATKKLAEARGVLGFHAGMVAVCDLICGQQLTPREITAKQREADEIETTLRLALDLLSQVFDNGKSSRSLEDAIRRVDAIDARREALNDPDQEAREASLRAYRRKHMEKA